MKEKILLLTLEKALKSVVLFKNEEQILKAYNYILTEGIKFLKININSLNPSGKEEITEKRLKKEKNKFALNEKIYNNIIKLESVLSKDEGIKTLSIQFKELFKTYKSLIKKVVIEMEKRIKQDLFFGETKDNKSKFLKKVGNKTFYTQNKTDGFYFVEEIIYSIINKFKPELGKQNFCAVSYINKEKYRVSFFNDISAENENGKENIEYSLKDFSEDEIKDFIKSILLEYGYDNNTMILLTIEDEFIIFNNVFDENKSQILVSEELLEELNIELIISKYKKHNKIIKYSVFISSVIIIGLSSFFYLKDFYHLEIVKRKYYKKLETDKTKIEKDIMEQKIKFTKMKNKQNLIELKNLKELDKKIYSLELKDSLNPKIKNNLS